MVRLLNLDFVYAFASMVCTFHWRDAINHIDTKFYDDNQSQGTVSRGNETRRELLKKTGLTYASTTRAYNIYGLPMQETDARGKTTTYAYDTYNLRLATSTVAGNHNGLGKKRGYAIGCMSSLPSTLGLLTIRDTG
jgi:YD repeat-containing protein